MEHLQCSCSAGAAASHQLAHMASLPAPGLDPRLLALLGGLVVVLLAVKKVFDTPSRTYDPSNPNVGDEYDSWTSCAAASCTAMTSAPVADCCAPICACVALRRLGAVAAPPDKQSWLSADTCPSQWSRHQVCCPRRDGILEYYWGEHIHLGYYSEEERARGYKKKDFKQAKLDFVDEMLAWSGARQPQRILDVGCGIGGTSRHLAATFPNAAVQGVALVCHPCKSGYHTTPVFLAQKMLC